MVKAFVGKQAPEIQADVLVVLHGLGIFTLSLVLIQLSVPAVVSIPLMLALSGASWYRWFSRRARALQLAAA